MLIIPLLYLLSYRFVLLYIIHLIIDVVLVTVIEYIVSGSSTRVTVYRTRSLYTVSLDQNHPTKYLEILVV